MLNKPRFQSIRSIVTSIILVLGLLSLAATLLTGRVYHNLTLDSQLENIERQLYLESAQTLQRVKQFSLQLSTLIVNADEFKQAIASGQNKNINQYLSQLSKIPYMQSGALLVRYVYVYDDNKQIRTGMTYDKNKSSMTSKHVCGPVASDDKSISYAIATDVVYTLCVFDNGPYLSARMPFVVGKKTGFIELVSDISSNISHIDQIMNFPIRLRLNNGAIIFISDSWPKKFTATAVASHKIKGADGKTLFSIDALHLDHNLEQALSNAQILVISGAVIVILVSVLLSLYILKITVINPVNEVVTSLRLVRDNRANLGAQVQSRGAGEIIELMDDFNAMSSALNQLYETLEKMAFTDSLTRLGNRKLFHEKLEQLITSSKEKNSQFALMLIDLDKFKQVNDTYGHLVGDQLLIETSNRFSDVIRHSRFFTFHEQSVLSTPIQDVVTRLGGDEFAILLPDIINQDEVIAMAKTLSDSIHQPVVLDSQQIEFGLSIGIAIFPEHAGTQESLIRCADEAMYHSKNTSLDFSVYSA